MKQILYEDNHLFVAAKPAGLLSQPTSEVEDSLETRGRRYIKETRQKPGAVYLHAAHRLDRVASGILVCGLSQKAVSRLNDHSTWKKEYLAVIEKELPVTSDPIKLEHRHRKGGHRAVISPPEPVTPNTKPAQLEYVVLAARNGTSLLKIRLFTGRYHQIRAQLSFAMAPIVGDLRYGSALKSSDVIALHHFKLTLMHPVRKEEQQFQCLPDQKQVGFKHYATLLDQL